MKILKMIAESGGTKTDWYGVTADGSTVQFSTTSYHPVHMHSDWVIDQQTFWSDFNLEECTLEFYGAGCLHTENNTKAHVFLKQLGFATVSVYSDLLAAAKVVDPSSEWIGICGTGSVLFQLKGTEISNVKGGLGWEIGDEGSGFYFGKLLVEKLAKDGNTVPEILKTVEVWKSLESLQQLKQSSTSKYVYAQLAFVLKTFVDHPYIAELHEKNVELFLNKYGQQVKSLSLVGSYAYFHKHFFENTCFKRQIKLKSIVARPIDVLVRKSFAQWI